MKICIYGESLKSFTSSTPMRGWVKELIKLRTDDSFIIALRDKPNQFKKIFDEIESYNNVSIKYLSYSRKMSNILALLGFRFYNLLKIKADLCIGAGDPDFFFGFKGKIINFLADLSSIRNSEFSSLDKFGKRIQQNILKHGIKYSYKTICISNFTKNDLNNLYPEYSHKTEVIYNGISDLWFNEKYINSDKALKFKKEKGDYYLWWGAISPRKNLINLLKAYKKTIKQNDLPKLLIIGEKVSEQEIFDKLADELKEYITLLPFQNFKILKGYVKESKGVLFPSFYEGFGLPVIEAYALGKNVLYANITSLPEVAREFGIPVNPNNVESIAEGLLDLNKNNDTFAAERKSYAQNFTYKKAALHISKIIDDVYGE